MSASTNFLLICEPSGCNPFATAWSRFCWLVHHSRFDGLLSVFMPFLWLICAKPIELGIKAKAISRWAEYVSPSIFTRTYPFVLSFVPHKIFSGCIRTMGFPLNVVSYGAERRRISPLSPASYRVRRPGIFFQIVLSIANYTKSSIICKRRTAMAPRSGRRTYYP